MAAAGRPRELFGPERMKYAPPFYTCGVSFTKFLVDKSDLSQVIGLVGKLPDGVKAVQAEIERITGGSVASVRDEWQRKIGISKSMVDRRAHAAQRASRDDFRNWLIRSEVVPSRLTEYRSVATTALANQPVAVEPLVGPLLRASAGRE